jgi:acetylornithine deacetylase/succinyl-diaminopimelate desuccinylase-like protein
VPVQSPDHVAAIWEAATTLVPRVLDLTEQITLVAAPTGDEGRRAELVAELFSAEGLATTTDELHDVVATLPGARNGLDQPAVLLAAHTDTVFPANTPLNVRRTETTLHGPGIGDNCLGVAAVLVLPELLRRVGAQPAVDLLLTGNVGEEGLGNLRGVRAVVDAHPRIGAMAAIEGHNLGRVTHIAVGSKRLRLTATGPGGHSWGDFGQPSALHALARLIAELDAIPLARVPKTTLNVGQIEGGVSVNTIAPTASCLVDMRSIDAESLARLADRVDRIVLAANRGGITVSSDVLGERPAGVVPLDSPIIKIATDALADLGIQAAFDASSTDANVPISRGIPAVCIGLTHGGHVHRVDEYIDTPPIATGLAQLAILALGLANGVASGELRRARTVS